MTQKLKIVIEVSSILGFAFKVPYTLFQETDLNMLSSYILLHLYPGGGGYLGHKFGTGVPLGLHRPTL